MGVSERLVIEYLVLKIIVGLHLVISLEFASERNDGSRILRIAVHLGPVVISPEIIGDIVGFLSGVRFIAVVVYRVSTGKLICQSLDNVPSEIQGGIKPCTLGSGIGVFYFIEDIVSEIQAQYPISVIRRIAVKKPASVIFICRNSAARGRCISHRTDTWAITVSLVQ